jgi:hypothetical protein
MSENATTNGQQGAVFIPEIWSQKLISLLFHKCVMLQCVNRNYEGEIKHQGDTVHINTPGAVTVSTLGSDAIKYIKPADSSQELIVDQKKYFAFPVEDVTKVQSNVSLMEQYLSNSKKAIEAVQDTFLLGMHASVPSANIVGTDAAPITLDKSTIYGYFVDLATALKNADATSDGDHPWVVVNPTIEGYIQKAPEFIRATSLGDKTVREGAIGRIAGMDVMVSTK